MEKVKIFTDGGARGNPGPAASAAVIEIRNAKGEIRVHEIAKCIGTATNNQAEYRAVIEALKWLTANDLQQTVKNDLEIDFYLDSELVVEQLNQRYKVKNEGLKPLFWQIRELMMQLGGKITFSHIRREQNKRADELVNEALDKRK